MIVARLGVTPDANAVGLCASNPRNRNGDPGSAGVAWDHHTGQRPQATRRSMGLSDRACQEGTMDRYRRADPDLSRLKDARRSAAALWILMTVRHSEAVPKTPPR